MRPSPRSILVLGLWLLCAVRCAGQATTVPTQLPTRITEVIDENKLVTLAGNVHPLARPEFDRGAVSDAQPLHRMLLLLQRSAEQETALRQLLDDQQSKASPSYHNWLTPDQFGKQFGPADADVQAVTQWLAAQGFTGIKVGAGRTVVEFSGNAGQVRNALHTEIHQYVVKGEAHFANASDPQIPAALAPVIAGIVSLHNFPAKSHLHRVGMFQKSRSTGEVKPLFTFDSCASGNCYAVGPADFATIYNSQPLLNGSPKIDGTGQGIAIVGESNINVQDVIDFRTMFGLPQNFSAQNVILNGPDPGINGSEDESDVDVEWSGAVAPGANIDFVTSAPTETTSGIDLSSVYIVDHNLDAVMSESFGECEKNLGVTLNKFFNSLWEQAAAQGITVILSAGDGGSAGCDDFNTEQTATQGLGVSGFASTPFNVAVGGTDFDQVGRESQFWNTTPTSIVNLPVPSSAKSYIPEVPWNDSCAGAGLNGCTSGNLLNIVAGSGGASTLYAKPSWQAGKGVPNDNHRDLPDVSLFASNGFNDSFYIMCQRDASLEGTCNLTSFGFTFLAVGGTSVSAPAFAGIMALVNQKEVTAQQAAPRQGNANYILYALAQQQNTANLSCNSSSAPVASCNFNDVTKGNNDVPCTGASLNCSSASAATGVLVATAGSTTPAYTTTAGYDLATGLGSVNAQNLVNKWSSVNLTPSATTLTLNGGTAVNVTHGQPVPFRIAVSPVAATGDASLIAVPTAGSSTGVGPFTLQSGVASGTTSALPGGTQYNVTAHYAGNGTDAPSDSTPVAVTIAPEASKPLINIPTFDPNSGHETSANATTIPYGSPYLLRVDVANSAGTRCNTTTVACPTGTVTLTDNGNALDAGSYALNSEGYAEDQVIQITQLPGGTHSIVANYGGDGSYAPGTATDSVTITPVATSMSVLASLPKAITGVGIFFEVLVNTQSSGKAPSGTVTFFDGANPFPGQVVLSPSDGTLFGAPAQLRATFNGSFSTNGTHTVTAKYSGDSNYTASTISSPISVLYPAVVTVTPSATSIQFGSSINVTAIVDTAVANLAPTGTVTFVSSSNSSSGMISGTVTYSKVTGPSGNPALQASISSITPASSEFISANYNGDSNYTTESGGTFVNVNVPDFSINPNPASLTLTAGQQASTTLTVAPLSGSSSSVGLSCTPTTLVGVTCAISPATVNLANNASVNATMNLSSPTASAPAAAIAKTRRNGAAGPFSFDTWWTLGGMMGIAALLVLLLPGRERRYRLATALGACAVIVAALGCGGGSSGGGASGIGFGGPPVPTPITISVASNKVPQGTMVTVTATLSSANTLSGTITFWQVGNQGALTPAVPIVNSTATNASATAQLNLPSVGIYQIYATYSGDSVNARSQSSPVNITVTGTGSVQVTGTTGPLTHIANVNVTIQ
jgi:hypothetical protein